jgi:hypothetical protein
MDVARHSRAILARVLRGPRRIGWIDRALHDSLDFLIDCPTVRSHLSDAHDDDLPPLQLRLLRTHVKTCAVCGPIDSSLRTTIAHLHDLRDTPPD